MWRKIVLTAVVVAVGGFAAVTYAQFGGGGKKGGGMSQKQKQRMQRIQELQRRIQRGPKTMDSHEGTVYMVKQGQLLKLNEDLEEQASVDLGRTFRPQVAAEADRVFLATYQQVSIYDTDLNEVKSVDADSIGRGEEGGQPQMQLPGMGE